MEHKRVTFKVAKAIKEAGYLQEWYDITDYYYGEDGVLRCCDEYEGCSIDDIMYEQRYAIPAPTYLDVWLWLWREKGIKYEIVKSGDMVLCKDEPYIYHYMKDPEEAIIAAIDYLVENNLIK